MGGPSGEHPPASTPDRQRVRPTRAVRRPPRLRTLENTNEERHASALELFFDLVFVVAIAELGETLSGHPTATGFLHFAVVFVPVWWAWVGYTVYTDRFDTDDLIFRLAMLTAMLVVVWMAIEIPSAFDNASGGGRFAGAYAAVRFGLVALYLRADHHEPRARPLTRRYIAGFSAGATLWLISAFTTSPARYALWGIAIAIELTPPLLSSKVFQRVPLHVSHIPERFAAFTIIALGETVVLVATGMASAHLRATGAVAAVFGFITAAGLWWAYFDFSNVSSVTGGRLAPQTYTYGHLLIVAGITATGVGTLLAIRANGATLTTGARWALSGGTGAFLGTITAIQLVNSRDRRHAQTAIRLTAISLLVALASFGAHVAADTLMIAVASVLITAILVEATIGGPVPRHLKSSPTPLGRDASGPPRAESKA